MTGILFILKRIGYFVYDNWRFFLPLVGIVVIAITLTFAYKGCTKKPIKFDEREIHEAQKAIADADRAKQVEILAKSDAKEQVADDISVNAQTNTVNAIYESKKKWNSATDEEIRAELERRAREE